MAATNRLRLNGLLAGTATPTLAADISSSGTTVTFPVALKYDGTVAVPTIADPDYLPLIINPDTAAMEIVWLTAYTSGATSGTVARGKEGTSGVAHSAGAEIAHGPTVADVGGLSPASPFSVETAPNSMTESGTINVLVFPVDTPVLAVKLAGDDHPRWVIGADPSDYGFILFGDGTFDPVVDGTFIGYHNVRGAIQIRNDLEITNSLAGFVLHSPANILYRIAVDDDGVLSTEVVT